MPRWSPDGKKIAFASYGDGRIWIVGSDGGVPQAITDKSGGPVKGICWSPDGENIFFVKWVKKKDIIYSVSSQGGELRKISEGFSGLDISPDGKKIVYSKIVKKLNQYWLLENFLPERKKD